MLSFVDYASSERITELLIKERVKVAIKGKLHKLSPVLTLNKEENNENLSIAEQLFLIMPPRDSWYRPQKEDRINSDNEILNRIEKFKGTNLKSAKSLNANKFSATQEHKLTQYSNKWLFRLLYKIAKRNKLSKEQLKKWWSLANSNG